MTAKHLFELWAATLLSSAALTASAQTIVILPTAYVEETAGAIIIEVKRADPLDTVVSVDFATEDVDAEAGRDYVAQRGTLRFETGERSKQIRIPILDDGLVERLEFFALDLMNPSPGVKFQGDVAGRQVPGVNRCLVLIGDNETPASLESLVQPAVGPGQAVAAFPDGKVAVGLRGKDSEGGIIAKTWRGIIRLNRDGVLDTSYVAAHTPLYDPGSQSVLLLSDGKLLLRNYSDVINGRLLNFARLDPAKSSQTGFRFEGDKPYEAPAYHASEAHGPKPLAIRRIGNTTGFASVQFSTKAGTATAGVDYQRQQAVVSFAPLENTRSIEVQILPDYDPELDETVQLEIHADQDQANRPESRAIMTIWDDDRIGSHDSRYPQRSGYSLLAMDSSGKTLGLRYTDDGLFTVNRFDLNGAPDPTWQAPKFHSVAFRNASLQPDGKVYLIGSFTPGAAPRLIRLNTDGAVDATFQQPAPFGDDARVSVMPDGKVLVLVSYRLLRLHPDGSADGSFSPFELGWRPEFIISVADKKVLLPALQTSRNGELRPSLIRLNEDGSRDDTFSFSQNPLKFADQFFGGLALADGSALVSGRFIFESETAARSLIRVSPEGKVDANFVPQVEGPFAWLPSLAQQPDGKLLLGGEFDAINGLPRKNLARLNLDGSVDLTFDPGSQAGIGSQLYLQPDGQIIVFDDVETTWHRINGDKRAVLIALSSDGTRFEAEVRSYSSQTVIIERATDLASADWQPIWTNLVTAAMPMRFADSGRQNQTQRFYRAVAH